jgi:hypothetical protein
MTQGFEHFQNELDALRTLFGPTTVNPAIRRLKEIYYHTEAKWSEYAALIPEGVVRYVLIGEAPPWSREGRPQFWLDSASDVRLDVLSYVFCQTRRRSHDDALKMAAERGFLLLDSIPFAMKYSSSKRSSRGYQELVRLTARSYLQAKIDTSPLTWSPSLRVAFSLKLNACAIISACGGKLSFGGNPHAVLTEQIAVNTAGYPDGKKLRDLYEIDCAG